MNYNPQFVRQAQVLLWIQWVFVSVFGWAFGLFATWGTELDRLGRFGVIGACLGFFQWLVLRHYIRWPSILWPVLTGLGIMVGQRLSQQLIAYLATAGIMDLRTVGVGGGLVIGGIIGCMLGASLALFQMPILRTDLFPRRYWMFVSVVGWGLGFQASTLLFNVNSNVTSLIAALLSAIITGLWVTQLITPPEMR